MARKGEQWSDHFERAAGAYNARPHEKVYGAPEDVEKQPATEFRLLQDNADKFQHNKDLTDRRVKAVEDAGAFRAPTNAARSTATRSSWAPLTVRSTEGRETLLKPALPAPQGSGNAAGQLTSPQASLQKCGPTKMPGTWLPEHLPKAQAILFRSWKSQAPSASCSHE